MAPDELLDEIRFLKESIETIREQYFSMVAPCANTSCSFYDAERYTRGNCSWTDEITKCSDYIPEE